MSQEAEFDVVVPDEVLTGCTTQLHGLVERSLRALPIISVFHWCSTVWKT